MAGLQGYFEVACCKRRRGFLPGDILICSVCDYDNDKATVIPNENQARDVPADVWHIQIPDSPRT
jgi:hypothetical protein